MNCLSSERDSTERLSRLTDELRQASVLTPDLVTRIVAHACTRVPNLTRTPKAERLERLQVAEAWTDAVLLLMELELLMWRPRRLVYDGGEWVCSLSRHCEVPIELDETAEGRHQTLPMAILLSFIEAKQLLAASGIVGVPSVPQVSTEAAHTLCCDNFR